MAEPRTLPRCGQSCKKPMNGGRIGVFWPGFAFADPSTGWWERSERCFRPFCDSFRRVDGCPSKPMNRADPLPDRRGSRLGAPCGRAPPASRRRAGRSCAHTGGQCEPIGPSVTIHGDAGIARAGACNATMPAVEKSKRSEHGNVPVIRANHVDKGWVRHYTACDLITALRFLGLCPILVGKIRVSP